MLKIHEKKIPVGDSHVKNILLGIDGKAYWIDLGGSFDETDFFESRIRDLLKFITSAYIASGRNAGLTVEAARLVAVSGVEKELVQSVKDRLYDISDLRLWYPTRFPLDGVLKEKVLDTL